MAVKQNVTTTAQFSTSAREVDFVTRFTDNWDALIALSEESAPWHTAERRVSSATVADTGHLTQRHFWQTLEKYLRPRDIVLGASFDNNIICVEEKEVIVVASVADALLKAMSQHGAALIDKS